MIEKRINLEANLPKNDESQAAVADMADLDREALNYIQ